MAAASRSATARAARACDAWVKGGVGLLGFERDDLRGAGGAGASYGGTINRTRSNFICGTVDVPTASKVGSVGHRAMAEGVKATQVLECGARFCLPRSRGDGVVA